LELVKTKVVNALTGGIMFVMLEWSQAYVQEILTSDAVSIVIRPVNQMKMIGARYIKTPENPIQK